jgi:pimeloyl-ACP methyl ester carboxylesterase
MWGLGVFSWFLLGAGIYLAKQAYDEFNRPEPRPVHVENREARVGDRDDRDLADHEPIPTKVTKSDGRAWAYLAGAVACLGLSFGGFWPVSLVLGNAPEKQIRETSPSKTFALDRPDGTKLHVEVYGDASRPTILLTHGWSLNTSAWNYIKGDLAERFRIVAWDLPGMGRSQGPQNNDYRLEKMAHDLEAVIRATASPHPLILLGHSIGGMVLQTFCRLYRNQLGTEVQGLVLLHTTYTNPLRTCMANGLATALEKPLIVPMNYLTIALSPVAWLSNWQSYLNGSLHVMTRFASFSGKQSRSQLDHGALLAAGSWPAAVARGNLAMLNFNEERTLPDVRIPVLVLAGNHDRMTLPSASGRLETLLPNSRPLSIDGGHLGYWEVSDRVVEAVGEFADFVTAAARDEVSAEWRIRSSAT